MWNEAKFGFCVGGKWIRQSCVERSNLVFLIQRIYPNSRRMSGSRIREVISLQHFLIYCSVQRIKGRQSKRVEYTLSLSFNMQSISQNFIRWPLTNTKDTKHQEITCNHCRLIISRGSIALAATHNMTQLNTHETKRNRQLNKHDDD